MENIELIYVKFLENSAQGIITSYGWTTEEELSKPLAKVLRDDLANVSLIYRKPEYVRIMEKNKKMKEKLRQAFDWSHFQS